ncbi:tyrosine-type recombinase/integrase [Variovorax rhizosphaerae]|uniref:Tyrosine-type recombinase/integrase n=1 Tax=Variovorax rhizosphaerae TaxID=1836200 RepID=A0ABU8WYN6_9BURK
MRLLLLRGVVPTDLARTLPGVATWRLWHLPMSLLPDQVERLLACCDRGSPVGAAVARYLYEARPPCATRPVFVRMMAPYQDLEQSAVCCVVRRALARAGLDPEHKGAHLLQHSLATNLLRRGASLSEIGQLLRHRQPTTTQIYAKVDVEALRGIALPWPRRAS